MSQRASMPNKVGSMNRDDYRAFTRTHLNADEPAPVFGLAAKRLQQRPSYGKLNTEAIKAAKDAESSTQDDSRPKPTRNDTPIARTPTGVAVSHKMFSSPQPDAKPVVIRRTTRANTVDVPALQVAADRGVASSVREEAQSVKIDAPDTAQPREQLSSAPQPREQPREQSVPASQPREQSVPASQPREQAPSRETKRAPVNGTSARTGAPNVLAESECIAVRVADGTYIVDLATAVHIGVTTKHRYIPSMNLKEFDRYVKSIH